MTTATPTPDTANAARPRPLDPRLRRAAGLALLLSGLATFAVEYLAISLVSAPYDVARQAVSDLGATTCGPLDSYDPPLEVCSPAFLAVNATWVITGLLVAVGAWLLRPRAAGRVGVAGALLVVLAALMQAAVGLVPVDGDLELHVLLALVGFLAQAVGLPLLGAAQRRRPGPHGRALGTIVLWLGLATVVGAALLTLVTLGLGSLPLGIVERVVIYAFQGWMIVAGVAALGRAREDG